MIKSQVLLYLKTYSRRRTFFMKQDFVEVDIPRTKKPVAKRSRLAAIVSLHQVKINVYQEADPALVSEIIKAVAAYAG